VFMLPLLVLGLQVWECVSEREEEGPAVQESRLSIWVGVESCWADVDVG
jgi:hypothetical protein